jgi:serine O-acetyltransferase
MATVSHMTLRLVRLVRHPADLPTALFATNWHALRLYRLAERFRARGHDGIATTLLGIGRVICGVDIVLGAEIGEGTFFVHGNGIVIGAGARIGERCGIFHQVTFGWANGGWPTIGDDVLIGAGAKLIGGITVGDRAAIGSNAVVVKDVPPGATVVGIPARIISMNPGA